LWWFGVGLSLIAELLGSDLAYGQKSAVTMSSGEFLEKLNIPVTRENLLPYLSGLAAGMQWYDSWEDLNQGKRAYCRPEGVTTSIDQTIAMIRLYLVRHPQSTDKPIGPVLLYALQENYPCR
jgi:hypothetical protein